MPTNETFQVIEIKERVSIEKGMYHWRLYIGKSQRERRVLDIYPVQ